METNREADLYTPKEALKPKGDMYAQITQIGDSIQESWWNSGEISTNTRKRRGWK